MRYFVESYGCTMNHGEGRGLSEDMASLGFEPAASADDADVVVLNTCTVVETTEKHMLSRISKLRSQGKEVVVTGCMAKAQPNRIVIRLPDSPVIPPQEYKDFKQRMAERYGIQGCATSVDLGTDAILPIAQGCLGNCSYCITKLARGDLTSYPQEDLLRRFDSFLDRGAKEVLVTAQDTSAYGHDTGTSLPALIRSMLEREGDFRIRIGMSDPENVVRIREDLAPLMDDERLYKFLHIPVQSGSNEVLRRMRRRYTIEKFLELVDDLRADVPGISIATDLICGFPGETEEDHARSVELIRTLRADTVNITRFSSRPGTDAAAMPQVHGRISAERSAELTEVKNATELDVNTALVGRSFRSLATEKGKEGTILRTGFYRPVVVREEVPLGTFADIEITEARPTYLIGNIINRVRRPCQPTVPWCSGQSCWPLEPVTPVRIRAGLPPIILRDVCSIRRCRSSFSFDAAMFGCHGSREAQVLQPPPGLPARGDLPRSPCLQARRGEAGGHAPDEEPLHARIQPGMR